MSCHKERVTFKQHVASSFRTGNELCIHWTSLLSSGKPGGQLGQCPRAAIRDSKILTHTHSHLCVIL